MNNNLFAVGLVIIGFTLAFLMPASMRKNWKELENKPVAGDAVVMLLRFFGLLTILMGFLIYLNYLA